MSLRGRSPSPTQELFPRGLSEQEGTDIPESKGRRLMELRLMQNTMANMLGLMQQDDEWLRLWHDVMPTMCLEHDNLLYAQFALSATHVLRTSPDDEDIYSARQNYFVLALREQRKAIAQIRSTNADAVCLTSMLILHTSFAMIHERPIEQYTPPIEWLKMGRGAGALMWKANAAVAPDSPASFRVFKDSYQQIIIEQHLPFELDHPFDAVCTWISKRVLEPQVRAAYRGTLIYINTMQRAIDKGDGSRIVGRRLQAFPMVVPTLFVDKVEDRDPNALLILAHYFSIAAQVDNDFWWLRGYNNERTAVNELQAIDAILARTCSALMQWPLAKANVMS